MRSWKIWPNTWVGNELQIIPLSPLSFVCKGKSVQCFSTLHTDMRMANQVRMQLCLLGFECIPMLETRLWWRMMAMMMVLTFYYLRWRSRCFGGVFFQLRWAGSNRAESLTVNIVAKRRRLNQETRKLTLERVSNSHCEDTLYLLPLKGTLQKEEPPTNKLHFYINYSEYFVPTFCTYRHKVGAVDTRIDRRFIDGYTIGPSPNSNPFNEALQTTWLKIKFTIWRRDLISSISSPPGVPEPQSHCQGAKPTSK